MRPPDFFALPASARDGILHDPWVEEVSFFLTWKSHFDLVAVVPPEVSGVSDSTHLDRHNLYLTRVR